MATSFPWNCPYCGHDATITDSNYSVSIHGFEKHNKVGFLKLITKVIVCPNPECMEYTISAHLHRTTPSPHSGQPEVNYPPIVKWKMKPKSQAKVFPSYIPKAIRTDYEEACMIRDLSPKASATLSRRCLQGIIRDFHKIKKSRLVDEIDALQTIIDPLIWEAIDSVRQIGNIGAHMEKDINLIIDVDPQEAAALIGLIEMLLKDWYIDKHEKQKQLKGIIKIATVKEKIKKDAKTVEPVTPKVK